MPKVSTIYGPRSPMPGEGYQDQRSILPPGGSPVTDQDFMGWVDRVCHLANQQWLDSFDHGNLPGSNLIETWQLVNHLYKWVIGWKFPDGTGPSRAHRIRFLGAYYSVRPTLFRVEASRYIDELKRHAENEG